MLDVGCWLLVGSAGYGREIVLPPIENATVFPFWLTAEARMTPCDGSVVSSREAVTSHSFNPRAPAIRARQCPLPANATPPAPALGRDSIWRPLPIFHNFNPPEPASASSRPSGLKA